jgi:hypothetical protein
MDHPLASWDSGKVDLGVVDAVEDIGEDCVSFGARFDPSSAPKVDPSED